MHTNEYQEIIKFTKQNEYMNTIKIQRNFQMGYSEAHRVLEKMEGEGIVEPYSGGRGRKVLI